MGANIFQEEFVDERTGRGYTIFNMNRYEQVSALAEHLQQGTQLPFSMPDAAEALVLIEQQKLTLDSARLVYKDALTHHIPFKTAFKIRITAQTANVDFAYALLMAKRTDIVLRRYISQTEIDEQVENRQNPSASRQEPENPEETALRLRLLKWEKIKAAAVDSMKSAGKSAKAKSLHILSSHAMDDYILGKSKKMHDRISANIERMEQEGMNGEHVIQQVIAYRAVWVREQIAALEKHSKNGPYHSIFRAVLECWQEELAVLTALEKAYGTDLVPIIVADVMVDEPSNENTVTKTVAPTAAESYPFLTFTTPLSEAVFNHLWSRVFATLLRSGKQFARKSTSLEQRLDEVKEAVSVATKMVPIVSEATSVATTALNAGAATLHDKRFHAKTVALFDYFFQANIAMPDGITSFIHSVAEMVSSRPLSANQEVTLYAESLAKDLHQRLTDSGAFKDKLVAQKPSSPEALAQMVVDATEAARTTAEQAVNENIAVVPAKTPALEDRLYVLLWARLFSSLLHQGGKLERKDMMSETIVTQVANTVADLTTSLPVIAQVTGVSALGATTVVGIQADERFGAKAGVLKEQLDRLGVSLPEDLPHLSSVLASSLADLALQQGKENTEEVAEALAKGAHKVLRDTEFYTRRNIQTIEQVITHLADEVVPSNNNQVTSPHVDFVSLSANITFSPAEKALHHALWPMMVSSWLHIGGQLKRTKTRTENVVNKTTEIVDVAIDVVPVANVVVSGGTGIGRRVVEKKADKQAAEKAEALKANLHRYQLVSLEDIFAFSRTLARYWSKTAPLMDADIQKSAEFVAKGMVERLENAAPFSAQDLEKLLEELVTLTSQSIVPNAPVAPDWSEKKPQVTASQEPSLLDQLKQGMANLKTKVQVNNDNTPGTPVARVSAPVQAQDNLRGL